MNRPNNVRGFTKQVALDTVLRELRQSIDVLRTNADLLQRMYATVDPAQTICIATAMERTLQRQMQIIEDLADLSCLQTATLALHRVELDLGKTAHALVSSSASLWTAGNVRIEMLAAEPLICDADARRMEKVICNLLDNALKYSSPGAEVVVRLSCEGGFARLTVVDSGCGIEHDVLPHVFGLGSAVPPSINGTSNGLGLGLALVHGFTVAHGGFVKAISRGVGRGSEFSVWLPLSQTKRSISTMESTLVNLQ